MSIFVLSLSTGVVIAPILDYLGQAGKRAKWMTISVTANVILNLILIPRYGGLGAAFATVLTMVLVPVLYAILYRVQAPKPAAGA